MINVKHTCDAIIVIDFYQLINKKVVLYFFLLKYMLRMMYIRLMYIYIILFLKRHKIVQYIILRLCSASFILDVYFEGNATFFEILYLYIVISSVKELSNNPIF